MHPKPNSVILSGGIAREASDAAVEGPHSAYRTKKRQGICTTRIWLKYLSTSVLHNHRGVLRLRRFPASRRICSAQDDNSKHQFWILCLPASSTPMRSYFGASTYTGIRLTPVRVCANTYQRPSSSAKLRKYDCPFTSNCNFNLPWFAKTSHEKTSHGFHGFSQISWTFYP